METVREVREELTCEHGEPAAAVCGVCGTPVCSRGSDRVRDVALATYEPGWRTLGLSVVLVVGVPTVFTQLAPELLPRLGRALSDEALFLQTGLVRASVLFGLALLPALRVRNGETFGLFVRRTGKRTVCTDCKSQFSRQRAIAAAVAGLGVLVALYGLSKMWEFRRLLDLWYVGLGAGLAVARAEVALVVDRAVA